MQIVIPMAGRGDRFQRAGYATAKPLIEVDGRPMIEYVTALFPGEEHFVFLCNSEHLASTPLQSVLRTLKPHANIVSIPPHADGPVRSIVDAAAHVSDGEPVVVSYCDFDMQWDYGDFLRTLKEKNPASASVCYKGFHPHLLGPNLYAGVRADANGFALEVREKHSFTPEKMDTWQQAGLFYFRSGALLKKYAGLAYDAGARTNGECYVSNMFNVMIKDGLDSLVYPVKYFCQWGTPEDLQAYNRWMETAHNGTQATLAGTEAKTFAYWQSFLKERSRFV